jgi:hypothetical protein
MIRGAMTEILIMEVAIQINLASGLALDFNNKS